MPLHPADVPRLWCWTRKVRNWLLWNSLLQLQRHAKQKKENMYNMTFLFICNCKCTLHRVTVWSMSMYVYYTIFTRMWMWNITTLVSEATSKPRACFTYHTVLRAATRPSQSTFCCSRWPWVVKWQWYGIEMNLCLCSVVCRWFWEKLVHGM